MARQGALEQAAADGCLAGVPRQRRAGQGTPRRREARALARTLGALAAFAGCATADLDALARAGRVTSLPAHWTFVHEGTPADACYVLLDGQARALRGGNELAVLGAGQVLGEMGLLGHSLRRASVVTLTPVRALRVEYGALAELLHARPQLAQCMGEVYAQHVAADRRGALVVSPA